MNEPGDMTNAVLAMFMSGICALAWTVGARKGCGWLVGGFFGVCLGPVILILMGCGDAWATLILALFGAGAGIWLGFCLTAGRDDREVWPVPGSDTAKIADAVPSKSSLGLPNATPSDEPSGRRKRPSRAEISAAKDERMRTEIAEQFDQARRLGQWACARPRVGIRRDGTTVFVRVRWATDVGVLPARIAAPTAPNRKEEYAWLFDYYWYPSLKDGLLSAFRGYLEASAVVITLCCTARLDTGHKVTIACCSVRADRETLNLLVPEALDGERLLSHFQLRDGRRSAPKTITVSAIEPFDAASVPKAGLSVTADRLTPVQFEQWVAKLLGHWGYHVDCTGRTGDGGVDILASNPEPVVGGTLVVQCKYYGEGQSVGSPAVRDLYGAVHDKRANKGILITTADFTPAARTFAEGKQIELINGDQLRGLLSKISSHEAASRSQRG